jgi:hypothetical protein
LVEIIFKNKNIFNYWFFTKCGLQKTSLISFPDFYKHNNNMNNGAFERGWHDECKFCEQRNKFWHKMYEHNKNMWQH